MVEEEASAIDSTFRRQRRISLSREEPQVGSDHPAGTKLVRQCLKVLHGNALPFPAVSLTHEAEQAETERNRQR